jgi:integrase
MARTYPGVYEYATKEGRRYRFAFRDSNGKPSSKRGFLSPQAAFSAKTKLSGKIDAGTVHVSAETFAEYFPTWLRGRKPFLTSGSYLDYDNHAKKRLIPRFGPMRIDRITRADVRDWLVESDEAGDYSSKTLNNSLGVLVTCLNQAAEDRLIAINPAAGVQRLPMEHRERKYLRMDEIDRYLDASGEVYRPLAELLVTCGLRISEALGLTWGDVDFEHEVVLVYRQAKGGGTIAGTKSKRFRRVDAGPDLLQRLADLKASEAEMVDDINGQPVFVMPVRRSKTDRGHWGSTDPAAVMDRNTVSRDWHKDTLKDAGLNDIPLHGLRHTAAASWLYCGQPLMYVQQQLGHASITTTQEYYGHLEESFLKNAARETEAAIRAAGRRATAPLD